MVLRAVSFGSFVLGQIWPDWVARSWDARREVLLVEQVLGKAAPSRHNPCMGKGSNAGLKKGSMVFISYNPNDVFWIALLHG